MPPGREQWSLGAGGGDWIWEAVNKPLSIVYSDIVYDFFAINVLIG